jgi:hypothetical protein
MPDKSGQEGSWLSWLEKKSMLNAYAYIDSDCVYTDPETGILRNGIVKSTSKYFLDGNYDKVRVPSFGYKAIRCFKTV